jgi:hypothetical protein
MGSKSDPNKAAMRQQKAQMARLDALELPELEEYLLQSPELVGLLEAEQLGDSELGDIKTDPRLKENQLAALEALKDKSEEGLSVEDKYAMEELMSSAGAQEKSQRAAIEQEMARKGMGDSGASLMAKLQGSQSAANQGRQQAMQMAAQGQQGRMSALQNMANLSGQMEGSEFNRQAQMASAQDAIARANAMNKQQVSGQNLAARQAIANQKANIANQQSGMANQIAQQNFANQMSKASGQGNVASNMSSIAASGPQKPGGLQSALGGAATGASVGGSIGGPVGAGYGAAIGAGAGLLSSFEDGGVAGYQDGGVPTTQQIVDKQALAEQKQHEKFKKDYMKRVRDELTPQKEAAEETTGVRVHAEDGAVAYQDGGSFQDVFRKRRAALGPGAAFMHNGKEYTTDYADEGQAQTLASEKPQEMPQMFDFNKANADVAKASKIENGAYAPEAVEGIEVEGVSNDKMHSMDTQTQDTGSGMSGADMAKGLGALSKMLGGGKQEKAEPLNLSYDAPEVKNIMQGFQPQQFSNPFTAEDGGVPCNHVPRAEDGDYLLEDGVIDVGEGEYAGDRIDAKVNEGEMIINLPQQQRLMDLLRGEISVDELGDDDIVEGVPREFRDEMHEEGEEDIKGFRKLLQMLGEE